MLGVHCLSRSPLQQLSGFPLSHRLVIRLWAGLLQQSPGWRAMAKGQKDKRAEKATKAAEAAEKRAASAARNPGVDPAGRNRSTGSTMHWEPKVRAAEEAPPGAASGVPGSSCQSAEGGALDGGAVMEEVSAEPTAGQSAGDEPAAEGWRSSGHSWADESEQPPANAAESAMAELKRRAREMVLTQGFSDGLPADDPARELITETNGVWWWHTSATGAPVG